MDTIKKEKISKKLNELGAFRGVCDCVYTMRRGFCTSDLTFDELIDICDYFLNLKKI
jgi:hypothetical protein